VPRKPLREIMVFSLLNVGRPSRRPMRRRGLLVHFCCPTCRRRR
jgi:hypothetical protein